jgi:hypothetical protein
MPAEVLGLPGEHGLPAHAIPDVRIVVERLGDNLSFLKKTVEKRRSLIDHDSKGSTAGPTVLAIQSRRAFDVA